MTPPHLISRMLVAFSLAHLAAGRLPAADPAAPALSPATQTILTGTVSNAATNRTLEGARVTIVGTDRAVLTDNQGVYRLANVPPGDLVLSVSYTGLERMNIPVSVTPGSVARHDAKLTSAIYTLGEFVVAGEREGNAQAITLQRMSPGVKSIVSADAFGDLAGNPADLLIRLPGVEGQSMDGDIRYVRIRGMSQNLSTVTVNGNRAAEAASAGSSREFQFEQSNADAIERMEVVKSPTPDMDGDSIGGAVNLVTKSAFDSSGERRIRGALGTIWRPFDARETAWPEPRSYALSYSEVFADRLGVAVNLGYRVVPSLLDQSTQAYQSLPDGVRGPAYTYNAGFQDARIERTRWGATVRFDFKLSPRVRFFVNGSLNHSSEHKTDYLATWSTNQSIASVDANGNFTGTGGIVPGYTDTFTAIRPVAASTLTLRPQYLNKENNSHNIQVGAVHRYASVDLDYDAYKSFSETNYPGTREISFIARGIGFTVERKDDPYFPYIRQTAGPDVTQLSSYTENLYNSSQRNGKDRYLGAAVNLTRRFDTPVPAWIKTGARLRNQERILRDTSFRATYVGPDGVMGLNPATGVNDDNLAQFGRGMPLPDTKLSRYPELPYPQYAGQGRVGIDQVLLANPQHFREDIVRNISANRTGNQVFQEDITAYYLMGNIDLAQLSILGGVRVETTEVEGEGALSGITPDERARRAAWVGTVTDAELRRRTLVEFSGRQKRTGQTRDVLPGLHFKYSPWRSLITRLSYATNVGRPSIGQLIPRTSVNEDNRTISTNNPGLKSQIADNFDFSAEYYYEPAGVVSVGLFLKEIKRFIYTAGGATVASGTDNGFGGEYAGYALSTQYNGGSAKVKGIEINYNQQFTRLPGVWSGLGAFATYTRMQIAGNYESGGMLASTSEVPGFNPFIANAGISYIRNRLTLRFQYNYTNRYLISYNQRQSLLQYTSMRRTLDIKTRYNFSRNLDFYLDISNVFNEPDSATEFFGGRARSIKHMSPLVSFGANLRL